MNISTLTVDRCEQKVDASLFLNRNIENNAHRWCLLLKMRKKLWWPKENVRPLKARLFLQNTVFKYDESIVYNDGKNC